MAKARYIVTMKQIETSNVKRLFGENIVYDPKTKTSRDGYVISVDGTLYQENLCHRLFEDDTKTTPVGAAVRVFQKVS